MTLALAGGAIERYYRLIDAADIDAVIAMFAANAVYERADAIYDGRSRISRFFTEERRIRGTHTIETILSLGDRAIAIGRFEGVGMLGDHRSVGFVDVWDFDSAGLVAYRRTFLATGHEIVAR